MKKLFATIIIILPLIGYSQGSFSFPEELKIDPYSFEMKVLKMERIEQLHSTYIFDIQDTSYTDSSYVFDYIVEYDTVGRIISFKYDFQKEYERTVMSSPESQVTIYGYNDTSRLETIINNTDSIHFNYYEKQFGYNQFNDLETIKIIRPYRGGIIDGVFIREPERDKVIIEKSFENNILTQVQVFFDGTIQYSETYEYSTLEKNEMVFKMLTKITRESSNRRDVYQIKYLQYL